MNKIRSYRGITIESCCLWLIRWFSCSTRLRETIAYDVYNYLHTYVCTSVARSWRKRFEYEWNGTLVWTVIAKYISVKFLSRVLISHIRKAKFALLVSKERGLERRNSVASFDCLSLLLLFGTGFLELCISSGSISRIFVESDRAIKAQGLEVLFILRKDDAISLVFFFFRRIGCLLLVSPRALFFGSFEEERKNSRAIGW